MKETVFFEDIPLGKTYEHFPGRTVFACDIALFAKVTHDPGYSDSAIVSMAHVYSLLLGLSMPDVSAAAVYHEERNITAFASVQRGDTLYCQSEVIAKRDNLEKQDKGLVVFQTSGYNQQGSKVMSFERHIVVRKIKPKE